MDEKTCTTMMSLRHETNGVVRTFECKRFGTELRIYRVHGDVTNVDELAEATQELAIRTGCDRVRLSL